MLNFKISEFIKSAVAVKNNINNYPTLEALDNILNLIVHCIQPVRNIINKPIIITSGYRCEKLNTLVKGKSNSQHKLGQAADFIIKDMKVDDIINIIKNSNIVFDQLINEYGKWVHISYNKNHNRKQILKIK